MDRRNGMYKFFSKPMANPMTILQRSAMPENVKVATISNEILRRLKCSSTALSKRTMETVISEYMGNLEGMGYTPEWRTKVLKAAIIGYTRVLGKVSRGETSRNRKGAETLMARRFKSLVGNKDWYRVLKEEDDATEIQPPWERRGA